MIPLEIKVSNLEPFCGAITPIKSQRLTFSLFRYWTSTSFCQSLRALLEDILVQDGIDLEDCSETVVVNTGFRV